MRHYSHEWTNEQVTTLEEASFQSFTHRQTPGDTCGSYAVVPEFIATCGYTATPRYPSSIDKAANEYLASAGSVDELLQSGIGSGRWAPREGAEGSGCV